MPDNTNKKTNDPATVREPSNTRPSSEPTPEKGPRTQDAQVEEGGEDESSENKQI